MEDVVHVSLDIFTIIAATEAVVPNVRVGAVEPCGDHCVTLGEILAISVDHAWVGAVPHWHSLSPSAGRADDLSLFDLVCTGGIGMLYTVGHMLVVTCKI
jgi:hypothetical protein